MSRQLLAASGKFLDDHPWFVLVCHLGMALETVAFAQSKVHLLRVYGMVAAFLIMTYTLIVTKNPLDCHAIWSFLHFSLNGYKLVQGYLKLYLEMKKLKPWDITCREWYFNNFTDQEFLALREYWTWVLLDEGDVLVEEGEEVDYMSMIFQGQAEIRIDGKQSVLAQIGPGSWVGEMAFFTGELASATVVAAKPTLVIRWEIEQIKKLLKLPSRSYKAQAFSKLPSHFCADLARKVKQYNSIPAMQSFIASQRHSNTKTKLKKFDNKKREKSMKGGFVSLVSVRRSWINYFNKDGSINEENAPSSDVENGQGLGQGQGPGQGPGQGGADGQVGGIKTSSKVHPIGRGDKKVSAFKPPRKVTGFYRQDTKARMRRQRVQSVSLSIQEDEEEEEEGAEE